MFNFLNFASDLFQQIRRHTGSLEPSPFEQAFLEQNAEIIRVRNLLKAQHDESLEHAVRRRLEVIRKLDNELQVANVELARLSNKRRRKKAR